MFENLTIIELNAMTKEQIIAEIVADRKTETCVKSEDCENGQVLREYVTKDLAGNLIKTETWAWAYKDGVVSEITKTVLDSKSLPIEAVKIATVDGTLKAVPISIKLIDVLPDKILVDAKG